MLVVLVQLLCGLLERKDGVFLLARTPFTYKQSTKLVNIY